MKKKEIPIKITEKGIDINAKNIEIISKCNKDECRIYTQKKPKSKIIIGELILDNKLKFNQFQKFMWKFLLNIKIEDVE